MSAAPKMKTTIDRIDPTDWYVGLKNPSVQLMVYGQNIRNVDDVTIDYPGATIDSIVRLDSPNYLLVYLNVKNAQPGTMTLEFKTDKKKDGKKPAGEKSAEGESSSESGSGESSSSESGSGESSSSGESGGESSSNSSGFGDSF